MYIGRGNNYTCFTNTSSHFVNENNSNPLDKDNIVRQNIGALILRQSIRLHSIPVWMQFFVCKDTFGTMTATYKAGSEADATFTNITSSADVREDMTKDGKELQSNS